jgi:hypothetical protein
LIPASLVAIDTAVLFPYRHFVGDDAYITFRFVRNLTDGTGYSYNAGEQTYGATAPLWVLVLAAVHRAGVAIPAGAHALNWIFSILSVALFWRLSTHYVKRETTQWVAGLLFLLNPWIVRWALSGMENSLSICLWLMALLAALRRHTSERFTWVSPLCAGLATLTRPEMGIFALLLFVDTAVHAKARRRDQLGWSLAIYLAILVPWLVYAGATFGTLVPNTITAKLSRNYTNSLREIIMFFASFWAFQAIAIAVLWRIDRGGLGALGLASPRVRPWFLPVAWLVALPLFYLAGGAPVSGRYLAYVVPCCVLLGARAWEVLDEHGALGRGTTIATVLATFAIVLFVQYRYCWFVTAWPEGMDPRMIALARVVRDSSRPGDTVAADQIGVVGYFSERRVLDIMGLVTPEMIPFRRASDPNVIWRRVRELAPQFLFLTDDKPTLLARDSGYASVELLREAEIQREGATAESATLRVYRTHFSPDLARDGETRR